MSAPSLLPPAVSPEALDVWLDFLGRAERVGEAELEALCTARPELADELRALWQREMVAPPRVHEPAHLPALDQRLQQLRAHGRGTRYRQDGIVAQGGMGLVRRVWDVDLDRALAQKVMLHGGRVLAGGALTGERELVARFLEEARLTGQLEHPGIVPVHDVGVDEDGRPYFTMKLVEGHDLRQVIALARTGAEDWSTTRLVGVLLRVCEAMAYAHARGVVHRDLKPANVMLGRFGEVYVMDWGVARALGRGGTAREPVASLRTGPEPALATLSDEVLGTPSYMAPEQARGEGEESVRVDVYAVGAMLYHVLTGVVPYVDAGEKLESTTVLARVQAGPPRPVGELEPRAPVELRAICAKAMARRSGERYATMLELADDLRAYLEGRAVGARPAGVLVRLRKWVLRNRALAAALALAAGLAVAGAVSALSWWSSRTDLALLARLREPDLLRARYEELWPATPGKLAALQAWLRDAEELERRRDSYRRELDELRAAALPYDPDDLLERAVRRPDQLRIARADRLIAHYTSERERLQREGGTTWEGETLSEVERWLEHYQAERAAIAALTYPRQAWSFADGTQELLHERLARIQLELDELVGGAPTCALARVRRAIAFAGDVRRRSLEDAAEAWRAALASIRARNECPAYAGLALAPQLGLVPLGRDPDSGLWEFAHLQSGEPARRGADGRLVLGEETGVVLVLVPAGRTHLGAQGHASDEPNFDPFAEVDEGPLQALSLDAFFLSKYELTQAQWRRWTGANPSAYQPATSPATCTCELHPVESITWRECARVLAELGLELPTEAQWEYAARAGTQTPWSSGATSASLAGCANLLDRQEVAAGADPRALRPEDPQDDGWSHHAPVGSFRANPWGFHDVHGNVLEWCLDQGRTEYSANYYPGTGERRFEDLGTYVARGGSCEASSLAARCAARRMFGERVAQRNVGVRPALAVRP